VHKPPDPKLEPEANGEGYGAEGSTAQREDIYEKEPI